MSIFSNTFRKLIMSNPKGAIRLMSRISPSLWERMGEKGALKAFHYAATKVPAYKDFLNKHGLKDPSKIQNIEDFKKYVPITEKKNYLYQYPLKELIASDVDQIYTLSMSSGASGKAIYYLPSREELEMLSDGFGVIFDYFWDVCQSRKKTLLINAFALGIWAGGNYSTILFKHVCDKYKNFSFVLPGADPERVVDILEKVSSFFDVNCIYSYPTLFKKILDEGDKRNLNWKKLNIKLGIGGEPLDDAMYESIIEKVAPKKGRLNTILEAYGGTETGALGTVMPIARKIKLLAQKNPKFSQALYGSEKPHGTILQSNALSVYIESVDEELVVSKGSSVIPLIRYNTKDTGRTLSFTEMLKFLEENKIDIDKELEKEGWVKPTFQWSFLILKGRTDWAISFFGCKISPEALKSVFNRDPRIHSFKISDTDKTKSEPKFLVHIELQPSVHFTEEEKNNFKSEYHDKVLNHLLETNFDFKDAYSIHPETVDPEIKIYKFKEGPFAQDHRGIKQILILK